MIELNVNGKTQSVDAAPDTPLLYVLRDHLAMNGAKFGCGLGQCGACTVMVDGEAVFSCVRRRLRCWPDAKSRPSKGSARPRTPVPLQRAFIDEQAAQCGYCIAGMIRARQALLEKNPSPSDAEIRRHMMPQSVPVRDADADLSRGSPGGAGDAGGGRGTRRGPRMNLRDASAKRCHGANFWPQAAR